MEGKRLNGGLLLPETIEVNKLGNKEGFIYKPVYGRVGERISIKEACKDDEYNKIIQEGLEMFPDGKHESPDK